MIELYQHRSYAKCISDGYKFLAENLWLITKIMWPYFLAVSMIAVCENALNMHANIAVYAGKYVYIEEVIAAVAVFGVLVIAYAFMLRRLFIMFKRLFAKKDDKELKPSPLKLRIKNFVKAFFCHFGKILGTTLLSLFLLIVVCAIPYLPFLVSEATYFTSVEGDVNFGDTTTISICGYILIFCLCILSYFIINMFSVAFYATEMFLYGSIKGSEKSEKVKGEVNNEKSIIHR